LTLAYKHLTPSQ